MASRHPANAPSIAALPKLGLGLSTNLGDGDVPDPLALLRERPALFDFVEYSAPLALEEAQRSPRFVELAAADLPRLFHPVHLNLWGPELERAENLAALDAQARAVGSPWVGNDVAWWHVRGRPFPGYLYVAPPFDSRGLRESTLHARHVQAGLTVPLCLENPTVVVKRGDLHVLDFMAELSARSGCGLILDLGHLLAFQLASGLAPDAGLDGFPLERVVELHLAGGVVSAGGYFDDHGQPVREEVFGLLEKVLPRCTGLRAVTFEGDGHPEAVASVTLERLRPLVAGAPAREGSGQPLAVPVGEAGGELDLDARAAWALFDVSFGRGAAGAWAPLEGDGQATRVPKREPRPLALSPAREEGTIDRGSRGRPLDSTPAEGEEMAQRLAVLAQLLDRSLPLTRALLAPGAEGLLAFQRSAEFREAFDPQRPGLSQQFAAFARREALRSRDAALAQTLSFELLLLQPAEAGQGRLAAGVRLVAFPVDLTELLFAYGALRRHLTGRALASGALPSEGWRGLRQVAARAPARPFGVALVPGRPPLPLSTAHVAYLSRAVQGAAPVPDSPSERFARFHNLLK